MKELFEMVEQFHALSGQPIYTSPVIPSKDRILLREKLINEEVEETFIGYDNEDIVEVIDGLIDTAFINIGTCLETGVTAELFIECFKEVSRSNNTKSCRTIEEAAQEAIALALNKSCGVDIEERNGRYVLIHSETKKLLKPSTYSKAELKSIIARYIDE